MQPPRALVFDLDGTLIDSRGDIAAATNHALVATGRHTLPDATIARFVGDGARALCARAAGLGESDAELDAVLDAFLAYYGEHPVERTKWMPHAREVLAELSRYPLALCTNKPRTTTDAVLAALGVRSLFATIVAGGDLPERKPAPGPVLAIAKQLGVSPEALVVVGDGPQDVEAGRRAGARTIGVRGGLLPIERLLASRPDVLVDALDEVPAIVARWSEGTARMTKR